MERRLQLQGYLDAATDAGQNEDAGEPFVLVEHSVYDGSYFATSHASMADAADYHDGQEYPEDWPIAALIERHTDSRWYPVSHTTFAVVPS